MWAAPVAAELAPQKPANRATVLGQVAAAARAAGASETALAALTTDAQAAKQEAADGRPLGARLDSTRARVTRCAAKASAAEEAVAAAQLRQQEAASELAEATAALAELEAEVARAPATPTGSSAQSQRADQERPTTLEDALAENDRLRSALAAVRGDLSLDEFAVAAFGPEQMTEDALSAAESSADEREAVTAAARTRRGAPEGGRAGSEPPAVRRRDGSASRTPPPPRLGAGRLPAQLALRR